MKRLKLHTVCQSALCPNRFECFQSRTATFLILGAHCTRHCAFCNIDAEPPEPVDPAEPDRVAEAAAELGLRHAVVTSVTRDDLPDGGAAHFAATIRAIRKTLPGSTVEVLIPDLQGDAAALDAVLEAGPDVLNHNLETVRRLYPQVRPEADYERSLEVLRRAAEAGFPAKSGLMLGLGETREEVRGALEDLASAGVSMATMGQYMQPSRRHHPVAHYLTPEKFEELGELARELGVPRVMSAPLVRSSYRAGEMAREGACHGPAGGCGRP